MKKPLKNVLLSLLVMALWGSLFPMVKLGYKVFEIPSSSIPDILMFAGMRFVISGVAVCAFCLFKREKLAAPKGKSLFNIVMVGLFSIVLHYTCTYIGLGTTDSSKTALIKQLGALIYVCFAFIFFKNERFNTFKIIGALVGFGGIIAINFNPKGISFSVGDMLIIGASVCTVVANVLSKKTVEGSSPYWITGISQLFGGVVLLAAAVLMGADMLKFNIVSTLVFAYICTASVCAYTLWYYVLKSNSLSKMFIIKFSEPLFACIFGAMILGENILKWQYLISFVLVSLGIILGNKSERAKET